MTATSDIQKIAQTLYDALFSKVLAQLHAAEQKVRGIDPGAPDAQQRLEAALPPDTLVEVKNFLLTLAREDMLGALPKITEAFESEIRGGSKALRAQITSAIPLGDAQRERIIAELRQRYNADLEPQFLVDESLIGGLIIRVGDQVLDNSLRTRLGAVQQNMLSS